MILEKFARKLRHSSSLQNLKQWRSFSNCLKKWTNSNLSWKSWNTKWKDILSITHRQIAYFQLFKKYSKVNWSIYRKKSSSSTKISSTNWKQQLLHWSKFRKLFWTSSSLSTSWPKNGWHWFKKVSPLYQEMREDFRNESGWSLSSRKWSSSSSRISISEFEVVLSWLKHLI